MHARALLFVVACAGCGGESAHDSGLYTRPHPTTPEAQLTERVREAAGGVAWARGQVSELRFRFVVEADGQRRADVRHVWDVRGRRDRVTWADSSTTPPRAFDVVVDLDTRTAIEATIDGQPATGDALRAAGEDAYARWVNDSYWLILPLKLGDPGVRRTLEAPRDHGGRRYQILHLSFSGVGLTPGDQYWLFIDEATARIERWEMQLENQPPPPRGISFGNYTQVGPLTLALDHVTDDGARRIFFEDVSAR